jgi:hypothetical protein
MADDTPDSPVDVLLALADDSYRLGQLQALPYVRNRTDIFPHDLLPQLYSRSRSAHILSRVFCGMRDLSADAIIPYLASKPVTLLVRWDDSNARYDVLGYSFIVTWIGVPPPEPGPRSAFAAYGYFPESWGSPDITTLSMLGLAYMFHFYKLQSIGGQRHNANVLTARFMRQFGFRDLFTMPEYLLDRRADGALEMADCTISRLTRAEFVEYVERRLVEMVSGE